MSSAPQEYNAPYVDLSVGRALSPAEIAAVTAANATTTPAEAFGTALGRFRSYVQQKVRDDLTGVAILDAPAIRAAIDAAWHLYLPAFARGTVPTIAQAYMDAFIRVREGNVPGRMIYDLAEEHARRLGQYFNDTSSEAVIQGFNSLVNKQVPQKLAIERALQGFGLTPRQMTGYVAAVELQPKKVNNVSPLNLKRKIVEYVEKSWLDRMKVFKNQEQHNLEQQAEQVAWMWMIRNNKMPEATKKQWITAKDEKVCKQCGPMHGKKIAVDGRFEMPNGDLLYTPGAHVNCRCHVRLTVDLFSISKADDDFDPVEHPRGGNPKNRGQFSRAPRHDRPVREAELSPELIALQEQIDAERQEALRALEEVEAPNLLTSAEIKTPEEAGPKKLTDAPISSGRLTRASLRQGKLSRALGKPSLLGEQKLSTGLSSTLPLSTVKIAGAQQLSTAQRQQLGVDFADVLRRVEERYQIKYKPGLITERDPDAFAIMDNYGRRHTVFSVVEPEQTFIDAEGEGTVEVNATDIFRDYSDDTGAGGGFLLYTGNGRVLSEAFDNHLDKVADMLLEDQLHFEIHAEHPEHGEVHAYLSPRDVSSVLRQVALGNTDEVLPAIWADTDGDQINVEFEGDPVMITMGDVAKQLHVEPVELAVPVVVLDHGYRDKIEHTAGSLGESDNWTAPGTYRLAMPPYRQDIEVWNDQQGSLYTGGSHVVPVLIYRVEPAEDEMPSTTRELTPEETDLYRQRRYARKYRRTDNRRNG